ncbi:hypothetical protein L21SP3_02015 [Sedimentisphaera cyanobacteriorum]|uniref:Uncharacterized protein n=1 Tax=Sedimentisphaera cyanobacteriorum TaxID=1940790 RepID=A0A1Q2HRV6_9BACT|nr:hypothetical protein [Sedimentisphaera cyanobacteriorum]AQQ10187.1 hypothetical protein L21SP3_02015 [Sedimentisphaera cyanobacteriorum]
MSLVRSILLISSLLCVSARADYLTVAKSELSEGTLSGIRMAHQVCKVAKNDPDYNSDTREFRFVDALSRLGVFFVEDDGEDVNSILELAGLYGLEVSGNDFDYLSFSCPANNRQSYQIPDTAPDAEELEQLCNSWIKPELDAVIDMLDSIESPEGDKFSIIFTTGETGLENDLRAGYGEVLIVKGLAKILRGFFEEPAYSLDIQNLDALIQNIANESFSAAQLLEPNLEFLTLLSTIEDPDKGKSVQLQNKTYLIEGMDYLLEAIDYIKNDNYSQPGVDRFVFIAEEDVDIVEFYEDKISEVRDSLANDNIAELQISEGKEYALQNSPDDGISLLPGSSLKAELMQIDVLYQGELELVYEGDTGQQQKTYQLESGTVFSDYVDLSFESGFFTFFIDQSKENITEGYLSDWEEAIEITGITGSLAGSFAGEQITFDLNPAYGSERFPEPISPRDCLPEFNKWNMPAAYTVGSGMDNDPTLGGILPNVTHNDWLSAFDNLQPSGRVNIYPADPWQIYKSWDGSAEISYWLDEQLVFKDAAGEVPQEEINPDISELYLAYEGSTLYGCIAIEDMQEIEGIYFDEKCSYEIIFSPSAYYPETKGAVKINLDGTQYSYQEWKYDWYEYWESDLNREVYIYSSDKGIYFTLTDSSDSPTLPPITGKYITVNSLCGDEWNYEYIDYNPTQLITGKMGTVQGTVNSSTIPDSRFFVQAYTNKAEPEDSMADFAVIQGAGDFELELPMGFEGYIRAYCSIFAFENPFEVGSELICENVIEFRQWKENSSCGSINVEYPEIIKPGETLSFEDVDGASGSIIALDLLAGQEYSLDFSSTQELDIEIYEPDARTNNSYYSNNFSFIPEYSGRYFVKITDDYYAQESAVFDFSAGLTSEYEPLPADIANDKGIGSQDGYVDELDMLALSDKWLSSANKNSWAGFADFSEDSIVNLKDFARLCLFWYTYAVE